MHFRSRTMLITLERSYPIPANKNNLKRTNIQDYFFFFHLSVLVRKVKISSIH